MRFGVGEDSKQVKVQVSQLNFNGGVISVNLYDVKKAENNEEQKQPYVYYQPPSFEYAIIAERLVFILPPDRLEIKVTLDKQSY